MGRMSDLGIEHEELVGEDHNYVAELLKTLKGGERYE